MVAWVERVNWEIIVCHDVTYGVFSLLYPSLCMWYVFSLLCRNLMDAYLCWAGWFEEYGMIVSVKEGFLYMEIFQLVEILWIVTFRKFILLLDSVSAVNFMLG